MVPSSLAGPSSLTRGVVVLVPGLQHMGRDPETPSSRESCSRARQGLGSQSPGYPLASWGTEQTSAPWPTPEACPSSATLPALSGPQECRHGAFSLGEAVLGTRTSTYSSGS